MSWENLEGGQEASQHKGEAYRRRVEEYLESKEFLSTGDPYSGTSDIRLTRPAHNEEKIFRVETKNTKASLADKALLTELTRQFIDFNVTSEEFEFHIFAVDYADQRRWKNIFRDRTRKEQEVKRLYEDICEKHKLNEDEKEQFEELDFDDFWRFLENVHIKKANFARLGELITENESREQRQKKWDFFTRENKPVQESGDLIPNFLKIKRFPKHIWTAPALVSDYKQVYKENPRYQPIWFEGTTAFSLIPPEQMGNSLAKFVNTDDVTTHNFEDWISENSTDDRIGKVLLNNQLTWRGEELHDNCNVIRHNRKHKLIFTTDRPVQQTLDGGVKQGEERMSKDGYTVTIGAKGVVGHRYGSISVKQYGDSYYPFIKTGWVFSQNGRGEDMITGDFASTLHHWLRKNGYDQHPNHRAQLKQWLHHLRTGVRGADEPHPSELGRLDPDQYMKFSSPLERTLDVRPPRNSAEQEALMEGDRIE
ncbi:hypothetical protein [Haloarcula sp. JP-L23]|uniref:hypothetical protein n=1 Tax=Haloarcula sp. JP-L23 TaxID=2716717 RepID=UPI00140F108A|nr:hypothetical protein G9465_23730 [Haloarcula sp. JP-L23]